MPSTRSSIGRRGTFRVGWRGQMFARLARQRLPGETKARTDPSGTRVPAADPNGADQHTTLKDGLDWQGFRSRYFPGRRRHDLEAISAYAAYRRSLVDERSADGVARESEQAASAGHTTLDAWEDEGGATP